MATIAKDTFTAADGRLAVQNTNWTEDVGEFSIVSNTCRFDTGAWGVDIAHHETALSGVDQYVKFKNNNFSGNAYAGPLLRYADLSTNCYAVWINTGGNTYWERLWATNLQSYAQIAISTDIAWSAGDTCGVTIIGTGNDTTVRVWQNPTGDAPDGGGTTWGSASPGITWTTDPSTAVDTGTLVGISGTIGTATTFTIDDFSAGDIPASGPPLPVLSYYYNNQ